jgi:hypothetical protein
MASYGDSFTFFTFYVFMEVVQNAVAAISMNLLPLPRLYSRGWLPVTYKMLLLLCLSCFSRWSVHPVGLRGGAGTQCSFVKLTSLTDGSSGMIHECGFVN